MPSLVLPTYYYRDHFLEMITTVARVYSHILDLPHRDFIRQFSALSHDAQCLFIRMANRRGQVFHRDTLRYAEIETDAAIAELLEQAFIQPVEARHYEALLAGLDKPALLVLAGDLDVSVRPSWPKARLLTALAGAVPFERLQECLNLTAFLARGHTEALDFLLYLYFGKTQRDLKSFALRDLGLVTVNGRDADSARFNDAAEARACFLYSSLSASLNSPGTYDAAYMALIDGSVSPTAYATLLRDRLAQQVGLYLERNGQPDRALAIYQTTDDPDCNERRVRLLHAQGRLADCRALLERLIDDPACDAEYDFATEFHARKFERQRLGQCSALLRDSQSIWIDEAYRTTPEAGAIAWFNRDGSTAYWTESGVWQAVFGLVFWEELFGSRARLHSGFDRLPRCLADRSFEEFHAEEIADRLDQLRGGGAPAIVRAAIDRHNGTVNALVGWENIEDGPVMALAVHAPPLALAEMLAMMAADFHAFGDGFPDLMLVRQNDLRFVEIKAEGDVVRRNQLTRLRQLQRAGFAATICRVAYRYDPEQTYVVVDVETTGSRAGIGRITEIGAVKLRNHQVIAEWHSLIDPQRHIPAFITSLTGIDDAMVAGAPKFAEIAADLAEFMVGSVFAAHSVNFDYGFIGSEFKRLGMPFRLPKFCTCAGMRRHFPGQASYSLGNLCRAFDIELERAHRALDDARAASALLCLINRQREERGEGGIEITPPQASQAA